MNTWNYTECLFWQVLCVYILKSAPFVTGEKINDVKKAQSWRRTWSQVYLFVNSKPKEYSYRNIFLVLFLNNIMHHFRIWKWIKSKITSDILPNMKRCSLRLNGPPSLAKLVFSIQTTLKPVNKPTWSGWQSLLF